MRDRRLRRGRRKLWPKDERSVKAIRPCRLQRWPDRIRSGVTPVVGRGRSHGTRTNDFCRGFRVVGRCGRSPPRVVARVAAGQAHTEARRCIAVNETTCAGRGHGEGVGWRTIAAREHSTGYRTRAEATGAAEEARIRAERLDGPSQTARAWAIAASHRRSQTPAWRATTVRVRPRAAPDLPTHGENMMRTNRPICAQKLWARPREAHFVRWSGEPASLCG